MAIKPILLMVCKCMRNKTIQLPIICLTTAILLLHDKIISLSKLFLNTCQKGGIDGHTDYFLKCDHSKALQHNSEFSIVICFCYFCNAILQQNQFAIYFNIFREL